MSPNEIIQKYFASIHSGDWQSFIADEFSFINSNLDKVVFGKAAYIEAAGRFFRATTSVEIRDMIIDGDRAAIIARYQLRSPKGNTGLCDVVEIITVKGDKLTSSAIFFDTKTLADFMSRG